MTLLSRLFSKRPDPREHVRPLWQRVVDIAREKAWYTECGIADSVPGRFDAVTLVMALVMLRLERDKEESPALIESAVRLTEVFVDDMDGQLRQSGVGDLVVGKRMGRLMSVLGGRIGALRESLSQSDSDLIAVLERNVTLIPGADTTRLAQQVRTLHSQIDSLSDEEIISARIVR